MQIETLQVGSFEVNCSVFVAGGGAWIVDPGAEASRIIARVEATGREPSGVLLTHAHFDHIGALPDLQRRWPGLPVHVHPADAPVIAHPFNQFPPDYPAIPLPTNVRGMEGLEGVAEVIETPGHTPGGVCYYLRGAGVLFSGDTLFAGSAGRTDFPGGSFPLLKASLAKLAALPDATRVIPGHGPETILAREKTSNPFLNGER